MTAEASSAGLQKLFRRSILIASKLINHPFADAQNQ